MSTADTIYELVKTLPEEQASLVLVFVEFLRQRFRAVSPEHPQALSHYFGVLQDSPNFNEDPVQIQRAMRSEWE